MCVKRQFSRESLEAAEVKEVFCPQWSAITISRTKIRLKNKQDATRFAERWSIELS